MAGVNRVTNERTTVSRRFHDMRTCGASREVLRTFPDVSAVIVAGRYAVTPLLLHLRAHLLTDDTGRNLDFSLHEQRTKFLPN